MDSRQTQPFKAPVRSYLSLRLASVMAFVFFPAFWLLGFYIIPAHTTESGIMRAICAVYGAFLFAMTKLRKSWTLKHHEALSASLALLITTSITFMCWLHEGYESPYYAGINTVVLVVGFLFSWRLNTTVFFNVFVYGLYISPLLLGVIEIKNLPVALSNQFFLVTTLLLTAFSQRYRVLAENREWRRKRTLRNYLSKLNILATRDPLTNLYNRRRLLEMAELELRRCERHNRSYTVLICDIDNFKSINDTHTHKAGDDIINAVSDILQKSVRDIDIVGRYGGEEFLVILPEYDANQVSESVAGRILEAVRREPLMSCVGPLNVTLSIGSCSRRLNERISLETLILRADLGLYQAKNTGKDRLVDWQNVKDKKENAA